MLRKRALALPGAALALLTSCSSSPTADPSPPPPGGPAPASPQPSSDLKAVALGVTIASRDDRGAPRLIRATVPRRAARAGMSADDAARDHLAALTPLWMHNRQPAAMTTHSEQRLRNGSSLVRLQQQVDHVDLHQGELRVLVNADGSLAAVSGTMRPSGGRTTFRSTAVAAVERALDAQYGATRTRGAVAVTGEKAGYQELSVAATAKLRVQSARAKRELLVDGNQLAPIWNVELITERSGLDGKSEPGARRYLINDVDGKVVRDVNLLSSDAFVYRAFADTTGNRNPLDGALQSYTPHPTGTPDDSLPGFSEQSLVVMDSFNGPRDPWLGPTATTTSGNNVDAYADLSFPIGIFNDSDIRPEVRAGRTLNYRYDLEAEALASPTQSKAAAVNVFFVTNWLHDWYYDSGFTESVGNAQVDNYGRGGIAGDPLKALAQADALGGSRDNAFMSTPADGVSPTMLMFLWSGKTESRLTGPTGSPPTAVFANGPKNFELDGEAVLAVDPDGGHTGCGPVAASVAGKIAVIDFNDTCASATVQDNLKAAGAIGVIAWITVDAPLQNLVGSTTANLPGLVLDLPTGQAFTAALPAQVSLHRTSHVETDGDLDNGIVAHEWGHYLHLRLASCEVTTQCAAMSEGWGDFVALHMMVRETDNREGSFAAAVYALTAGGLEEFGFRDPGYFGIRRYPYSLDRAKNPLSFRHISDEHALPSEAPVNAGPVLNGNAEPHNAGEVWTANLWEVYNILIDAHGYTEARRRMSDYVVAGLLLTPPEATYTEGRDALLAAVSSLDTDDMILMAAAFANRGIGTCAVAPARASVALTGVVESRTLASRIETSAITLTDDGASCDRDGYLDPGESGTLHITVANSGVVDAEGVVVTATTTSPGVILGKPIALGNVAAFAQIDVQIPVRIAATAPTASTLDIAVQVTGDAGCNTGRVTAELHQRMGIDEAAGVSTTDNLEVPILAWTPTGTDNDIWSRTTDGTDNHVLFAVNANFTSDTQLVSPVLQVSPTAPLVVSFQHTFDLEGFFGTFYDGGVIEISNDGGATWRDANEVGVDPGYTGTITTEFDNPIAGRDAYSAVNSTFPLREPVVLDFGTQFAGQAVQIRFRVATDLCCFGVGWEIDDIAVTGITNAPFPGYVAEPTVCTVRAAGPEASSVAEIRNMPRQSLVGVAIPTAP